MSPSLVAQLAAVVVPIVALAALGWAWVKRDLAYETPFVTRLVMEIGTPCLIFATLAKARIEPAAFREMALATLALYGAMLAGGAVLFRALGLGQRVWLAPFAFGNTGNIGLPLCLFAYGAEGLALGVVAFATMAVMSFTLGIWVVSGERLPREALRQPLVYASIAGAVVLGLGWELPRWLDNTVTLAGQMTIPLMLVTLGAAVASLPVASAGRTLWLSAAKALASAGLAFGIAWALGLGETATGVFVLQAITPVAVTSYLIAEQFGTEPKEVARYVMVSTLMSLVTVPLALAWLLAGQPSG